MPQSKPSIALTRDNLHAKLTAEYNPAGHWTGHLSSSALATAVAVVALARIDPAHHAALITGGLDYLARHANSDGGWGDSPESPSNLTATLLGWCAFSVSDLSQPDHRAAVAACEAWLRLSLGTLDPDAIRRGVFQRYARDRTFSAPILAMAALCGRLGPDDSAWERVPQLPFELAGFPPQLYRWLRLTVVSYALPALIAIGILRHKRRPTRWPVTRRWREAAIPGLLEEALRMQPANGGYEEATPLTAFVALSLTAAGFPNHPIVRRGISFLQESVRPDGSWPIDTNLSTWLTTLSVNTLLPNPAEPFLTPARRCAILDGLLAQQHNEDHPLTHSEPGGWAWTNLPGGMPDADDTCGVLIALRRLDLDDPRLPVAVRRGITWLLRLQNSDGGIPTFSKGWGKLPFDRSSPDISAHTLQAFASWHNSLPHDLTRRTRRATHRIVRYLQAAQHPDGYWIPLWFGNQSIAGGENPVFGTAKVLTALRAAQTAGLADAEPMIARGLAWLASAQNPDGGWGGARNSAARSSIEETGIALEALAGTGHESQTDRGAEWIATATANGTVLPAAPIGLYFTLLWYSERLYPIIFALAGLRAVDAAGQRPKK